MDIPTLQTPRLILRPLTAGDAGEIERHVGDWDLARWTSSIPHPYPAGAAAAWIASLPAGPEMVLGLTERGRDRVIGCIGLRLDDDGRSGEFGYWVAKPMWGKGYATEALQVFVGHAFKTLALDKLISAAMPANAGSIRVQEKAGFRKFGEENRPAPARDGDMFVELRELDRATWERMQAGASAPLPTLLVAAVALIDTDGRVLLARRPPGKQMAGLWEFPGGKIHAGETPEAALIRELKEELAIDVTEACLAPFTFASHRYEKFHLLMPLYVCRRWKGQVLAMEEQALKWVKPRDMRQLDMPPADLPLIPHLIDLL